MKKNKININDKRTVLAVQEDFNKIFPYLKIEFLKAPFKPFDVSKKAVWQPGTFLGECRTIHNSGVLDVNPESTVAALVKTFYDTHGLSIQIFRNSGKAWLETSKTDYWSLEQQNKLGEELSKGN